MVRALVKVNGHIDDRSYPDILFRDVSIDVKPNSLLMEIQLPRVLTNALLVYCVKALPVLINPSESCSSTRSLSLLFVQSADGI